MSEIIIGFLLVFTLIREWMCWKERQQLCKELMAKNLTEYASFEVMDREKCKCNKSTHIPL